MTEASDIVQEVMRAASPTGNTSFKHIVSAGMAGSGRHQTIFAEVKMFDGQPATLKLERWQHGWSHQWMWLPGGPVEFVDGSWRRVAA